MIWLEPLLLGGLAAALILAETLAPARPRHAPRWRRWGVNLATWALGGGIAFLALRAVPVGAAALTGDGIGLLGAVQWPAWLEAAAALLLLDLAIYLQHRAYHLPGLWRLHAAHHADPELDVSTGVRFHPFELLASLAWKTVVVVGLGAPAFVVLLYEALLSAASLFTHANIAFPPRVERALSFVIITPHAHRLHHDRAVDRKAPNYGTILSLWDRLFGTWRAGPEPAQLGLEAYGARGVELAATLASPFRLKP